MPKRTELQTHLIAHGNKNGGGPAQAKITATSEAEARTQFREMYPERVILNMGVLRKS